MFKLYRVKAFSSNPLQGNLAGVLPEAESLSPPEMQKIAAVVNASETAFVFPSEIADFRIRWFTPNTEVGMCIHATVAALGVLKAQGKIAKEIVRVETNNTILECQVKDGGILVGVPHYRFVSALQLSSEILHLLKLANSQIIGEPGIIAIFEDKELVIEVGSLDDLRGLLPNQDAYSEVCHRLNVTGISIFTRHTFHSSNHIHTREFAPLYGYLEDPLCGMAAGAIYTYLGAKDPLRVEQGYFCNTSGVIQVQSTEDGSVEVGGAYHVSDKVEELSVSLSPQLK